MAFLTGSDESADVSITVFPNQFRQASTWLATGQVVVVTGKVERKRGLQLVANRLSAAPQPVTLPAGARWFIRVDADHDDRKVAAQLAQVLTQHAGDVPVIVYQPQTDQKRVLPRQQWLTADAALTASLERLMGAGNVVFKNG